MDDTRALRNNLATGDHANKRGVILIVSVCGVDEDVSQVAMFSFAWA